MQNTVNERIRLIYKSLNITLKSFSNTIGISEGTLKSMFNRGTNPGFEILEKIANAYPDISMDWLVTGNGEMLKDK
ncbi:MAG: helix-turn-helix transcriptional regulator [Prevotella sp.]|jgi:transcriptional regulator with XRE-family HTH domain|nr:helix-turn-helix transcriptional regulator [Prevotella sp.]